MKKTQLENNQQLKELIRNNKNDLNRWIEKRNNLRNKIKFCSDHKFEEEVRISRSNIASMEGIIYDFENCLKELEVILKAYEKDSIAVDNTCAMCATSDTKHFICSYSDCPSGKNI